MAEFCATLTSGIIVELTAPKDSSGVPEVTISSRVMAADWIVVSKPEETLALMRVLAAAFKIQKEAECG